MFFTGSLNSKPSLSTDVLGHAGNVNEDTIRHYIQEQEENDKSEG